MKLSSEQERSLRAAELDQLWPVQGGYWITKTKYDIFLAKGDGWMPGYFRTNTVYSLCQMGLLSRLMLFEQSYRDPVRISIAGRKWIEERLR